MSVYTDVPAGDVVVSIVAFLQQSGAGTGSVGVLDGAHVTAFALAP